MIGLADSWRWMFSRARLDEWETLSLPDADEGDFVTLSDGAQMHYVVRASTALRSAQHDVVMVHGLMSTAHEWAKNMDALAAAYRVWAIDLIGFGYSSRIAKPCYSLEYHARSLGEFLDAQGIERTNLVGHSLGGGIALEFARQYPERLEALVLVAPYAYPLRLWRVAKFALRVPYVPRALATRMIGSPRAHRAALCNALGDPARLDEQALAARIRATRVKGTLDALLAMSLSPRVLDAPKSLREIVAPTLLIWGDRDAAVPLRHGNRLVRELPNAELAVLKGAGHLPHEEFPAHVNALMLDFFQRNMPH